MEEEFKGLAERLSQFTWPSVYMFKFIVPAEKQDDLRIIFRNEEIETKFSRTGKYFSLTSCILLYSGEEVIEYYRQAKKIEGVVAL